MSPAKVPLNIENTPLGDVSRQLAIGAANLGHEADIVDPVDSGIQHQYSWE